MASKLFRRTDSVDGASKRSPRWFSGRSEEGAVRRDDSRDESGAILILALIYILTISLIVTALSTWATNNLNNTSQFTSARSKNYAATNATELAIQSIRYKALDGITGNPQTLNANPPSYCWGTGPTSHLLYTNTTGNVDMAVWCSTVESLARQQTRTVRFTTCLATVSSANCAANPYLEAVVVYNDYPPGGALTLKVKCPANPYCGNGATLETWNWGSTAGSSAGQNNNSITVTSAAPSSPTVGGAKYTPAATATSGDTVAITSATPSVCSIASGLVSFLANGTCTLSFNDSGNASYDAAQQVQQTFSVGQSPNVITITSAAPSNAIVNGAAYNPTATASSGDTVAITSATPIVCTVSVATVSFGSNGTCTLNFNDPGNSSYVAATQVQQSFLVGGATMGAIQVATGTETANLATVVSGSFTATASSTMVILVGVDDGSAQSCSGISSTGSISGATLISSAYTWYSTGGTYRVCAFSAKSTGSAGSVTATLSGSASYASIQVIQITGDTGATIGLVANSSGSNAAPVFTLGGSPSSGSSELLFGDLTNGSSTTATWSPSSPTGFTQIGTLSEIQGSSTYYKTAVYFGTAASPLTGAVSSSSPWGTIGIEVKP